MIHFLALLGVLSISFSAIFVRLAAVSPVTATFYRAAYAAPILALIWFAQRASDRRSRRERWLVLHAAHAWREGRDNHDTCSCGAIFWRPSA